MFYVRSLVGAQKTASFNFIITKFIGLRVGVNTASIIGAG